jgi:hypothetical protein
MVSRALNVAYDARNMQEYSGNQSLYEILKNRTLRTANVHCIEFCEMSFLYEKMNFVKFRAKIELCQIKAKIELCQI